VIFVVNGIDQPVIADPVAVLILEFTLELFYIRSKEGINPELEIK
jgi:hypothetical protein